ncbi:antA/AntB antirepressor family protein [Virgibacillus halodenitrificans]|uniref:antA/AntB antirepressor family protein n=1 Tax=Virgibacillus halodenitrificans TaxID=1482 RepID=UPI001FB34675|nr:antA/AntB antirepressor family protein [Virgibacillus halodenitrificans]MCJ0932962.1 antA/AntB antirepressor family protein [Virgibacillus halodenitrificans]
MNQLKVIANDMLLVYENQSGEKLVNARELHNQLLVTTPFHKWIERRIENYGFIEGEDFWTFLSESNGGRPSKQFLFSLDTGKEIAMVENNEQGRSIRKYFIQVEKQHRQQSQPKTIEDIIILQAQSVKELKQEVTRQKEELTSVKHRIDNFDSLDTVGDLQQRLNKMVQKYAAQNGISFPNAWRDFRKSFNTAYRTNLKMLVQNYALKHSLKSLSAPQYLSLVNRLEDGIRVADKMLNQSERSVI